MIPALLLLLLPAVGCSENVLVPEPHVTQPYVGSPSAAVSPARLDFGAAGVVEPGAAGVVDKVLLENTGDATLQLFDVWFEGGHASLALGRFDILTVAADDELAISVEFAPTAAGLVEDELRIYTDDPDRSTLVGPITGEGVR